MFFAKILIERIPKNHLEKHPSTQNNPLVVLCNVYRSTSKYQVKSMCISDKTEICPFVYINIIIIPRTASHTTKYIHQRDSPPVRLLGGECIIPKSTQYVTVVTDITQ